MANGFQKQFKALSSEHWYKGFPAPLSSFPFFALLTLRFTPSIFSQTSNTFVNREWRAEVQNCQMIHSFLKDVRGCADYVMTKHCYQVS